MSTPEAVSDVFHPQRLSTARERALIFGVTSVIAGAAAFITAVWDWIRDSAIPNTLPMILGIVAVTTLLLHERHDRIDRARQLTAEIEQATTKLTDVSERVELAFEAGRRYAEATSGQNRPRAVN